MKDEVLQKDKGKLSPMMISGITIGAAGLAGVIVGGVFAGQYQKHLEEGNDARNEYEDSGSQDALDEYNRYKDEVLPRDQAAAIAGFVAGGVCLVTGVVLIAIDASKKKKSKEGPVSVFPSAGGVTVRF